MSDVQLYALSCYNDCGGYAPEMVIASTLPNPEKRTQYTLATDYNKLQSDIAQLQLSFAQSEAVKQRLADDLARLRKGSWPQNKDVGRYGDMSPHGHMRVGLDSDNDVYVSIWDEDGGASVEFCCPGSGGGRSPKTREALIALMLAMEADNVTAPDKDWWARRAAPSISSASQEEKS